MREGRSMEYETMVANIEFYIKANKDFFVGGRGIGFSCRTNAIGWYVEIERAVFKVYTDKLKVEGYDLKLYVDEIEGYIAKFDLRHYLKVQAI